MGQNRWGRMTSKKQLKTQKNKDKKKGAKKNIIQKKEAKKNMIQSIKMTFQNI